MYNLYREGKMASLFNIADNTSDWPELLSLSFRQCLTQHKSHASPDNCLRVMGTPGISTPLFPCSIYCIVH
jgi:hypothetical protein